MNFKSINSVLSLVLLFVSASFASAQNVLLFTFDDSGPNVTATVTGSFDTSGLTPGSSFFDEQQTQPVPPPGIGFGTGTLFSFGTTAAANVDRFSNARASEDLFSRSGFFAPIVTPLSEYLEIHVFAFTIRGDTNAPTGLVEANIGLAEGETIFNADALENNVIVYEEGAFVDDSGNSSLDFLSSVPTTMVSDPNGENIIQFVLATETILGDVNGDGVVNFDDIPSFVEVLLAGMFRAEADVNQDSEVNFEDIPRFVEILLAA